MRAGLFAFLGACALLAPPTAAASISLDVGVTVSVTPEAATVTCEVRNVGREPAWDVAARAWRSGEARPLAAELAPGAAAAASWTVPLADWRATWREIAAVRVGYRDVTHHRHDVVHAHGAAAPADVDPPAWPRRPDLALAWTGPSRGAARVEWWSPEKVAVEPGGGAWTLAAGSRLEARAGMREDVTGWRTSAFALVLPDDGGPGLVARVPVRFDGPLATWRPDARLLAGWLVASALFAAAGALLRRDGASALVLARDALPSFALLAVFGAIMLTAFPPRLLLLDVTPAGGDYGSHVLAAQRMRDVLLPSFRLTAWEMGQYGGFPLFLFYFPLVFVLIAAIGWVVPIGAALKVGSLAGVVLLPWAWHRAARWLGGSRATAWCAAASSLWLLLLETQQAWGGNLPSLLAGEFAYALGFPLAWLAMARGFRGRDGEPFSPAVPVLLALTALAHGYALVAAALGLLLLLVAPRRVLVRAWMVGRWGIAGFGLCAFFLVPLAWGLGSTNGFREQWRFDVARELVPPILWPAAALALASLARRAASPRSREEGLAPWWLFAFAALMLACWRLGYSLGVVDIRFLPFFHGALLLAAAFELGHAIDRLDGRWRPAATALAIGVVAASAAAHVRSIPTWARWNLSGMEAKPGFPAFAAAMEAVRGPVGMPRVAFEHHPEHDAIGTIRAFELIPHFSGRATLEGLYMQSAPLAPAAFHVQSLLTRHPSCPLPAWECETFDPARGVAELRMLGADTLVTYTDELDAALEGRPDVALGPPLGALRVARLVPPPRLVEPAAFAPVRDLASDADVESYAWLRAGTDFDVPLVVGPDARADVPGRAVVERYAPGLPRAPLPSPPRFAATVSRETVELQVDSPGHPFVVRVAHHPGWRASDGSSIERVAPGFMLVTPRSGHVRLTWSTRGAGVLGAALTLATVLALAAHALLRPRLPAWSPPADAGRAGMALVLAALAGAGAVAALATVRHPPVDRAALLREAADLERAGSRAEAESLLRRALAGGEPHPLLDDAAAALARLAEGSDDAEAARRWRDLLAAHPVSRRRAEALVRLARLELAAGDASAAGAHLCEALAAPLAPPEWRDAAAAERAALGAAAPPCPPG